MILMSVLTRILPLRVPAKGTGMLSALTPDEEDREHGEARASVRGERAARVQMDQEDA
jgi:hypothetical protein